MARSILMLLLAAALAAASPSDVAAQQSVGRIVASVNDDAITDFDVLARVRLLAKSSNLTLTPELERRIAQQALRDLIDERLKMQEAERLNISASDQEVGAAIRTIERNNNMAEGALMRELTAAGVPVDTLIAQVKSTLVWRKVLRNRVLPQVRVGTEEVDEALARIRAAGGGSMIRAAEIFLPASGIDEYEAARREAQKIIEAANGGADFGRLAAQYSRAATAAVGGDLGEVQPGQLTPELETALAEMTAGEISAPIETDRGVYILKLIDRRRIDASSPDMAVVTLARAVLPARPNADAAASKEQLIAGVRGTNGCDAFEAAARNVYQQQPPRVVDARIGDLPEEIRGPISALAAGEMTDVLELGDAYAVIMLCRRAETGDGMPSAQRVAEAIQNQRALRRAERYLRDLRRVAFIDIRG